jgi:hypothetical protein
MPYPKMKHMNRFYLILLAIAWTLQGFAQTFPKAEYFFDKDPGVGKGISISVSGSGDAVKFSTNISTNNLSEGFHFLGIRVQESNGAWGMYERRMFYVSPPFASQPDMPAITGAEYFIDSDPGAGKGTQVAVGGSGNTVNFTASIPANLSAGFHFLGMRTRDAGGRWGMYERRMFYVSPEIVTQPDMPAITGAEYFIDSDPGAGKGHSVSIGGSGNTVNFTASIPANLSAGFHFLGMRTRDAGGRWGMYERRMFYVSPAIVSQPDMPAITGAEFLLIVIPVPARALPLLLVAAVIRFHSPHQYLPIFLQASIFSASVPAMPPGIGVCTSGACFM